MTTSPTPQNPNEVRGPIEAEHNAEREAITKSYVEDRRALEDAYHDDLKSNREAKQEALAAAGLNPDGSVPPSYYAGG